MLFKCYLALEAGLRPVLTSQVRVASKAKGLSYRDAIDLSFTLIYGYKRRLVFSSWTGVSLVLEMTAR